MKVNKILIVGLLLAIIIVMPVAAEIHTPYIDDGKILLSNGTYWIRMDLVSDRIIGDDVLITGTTNFPQGMELDSELYINAYLCRMKICNIDLDTYNNRSLVTVQPGQYGENNTFTILFPTKNLMLQGDYSFEFHPYYGETWYSDRIVLFPAHQKNEIRSFIPSYPPSEERYWIWITPSPDEYIHPLQYTRISHSSPLRGDSPFQVTGLTNLPVGEKIPYSIIAGRVLDDRKPEDTRTITLASDRGYVIPGEKAGMNKFIIDLNASRIPDDGLWITIWNPRYNASIPNDFLSASIKFDFNKSANVTTPNNITVTPRFTSAGTPLNTQSPLSMEGTCFAVIVVCVLSLTLRRRS